MSTAFYCVADERYFLGAVGLVNSLRLVGHDEPIHLLDCGLTADQRKLLEAHVNLQKAPAGTPPWLLKTVAPLADPADVMVLIDADMVATRHMGELIERAGEGRVLAAINESDRHVPDWGPLLGLGETRRRPYVSSGLVLLDSALGGEILELMHAKQSEVDFDQTFWRHNVPDYPFLYGDQDVLNAILSSDRVPETAFEALEHRLAPTPPFGKLRVLDEGTLRCAFPDGTEPVVLHNFYRKPWLVRMRSSAYSRLLTRSLLGADVALQLDPALVPPRLRSGAVGAASRAFVDVAIGVPSYLHRRLFGRPRGTRGWADASWEGRG